MAAYSSVQAPPDNARVFPVRVGDGKVRVNPKSKIQNSMKAASLLPDLPPRARILIIRLRSIGDIILLTPALRLLKEWRPDLRISLMVESRFRELLQGNPAVEEVLIPGEGSGARNLLSRLAMIR